MWKSIAAIGAIPPSRSSHNLVAVDGIVYLIGGEDVAQHPVDTDSTTTQMFAFNMAKREWRFIPTKGNFPPPLVGSSAVAVGTNIWVFGGRTVSVTGDLINTNSLFMFDTLKREWSLPLIQGNAPSSRFYHSMAALDDHIYVFGGYNSQGRLNDLYCLDTSDFSWTKVAPHNPNSGPKPRGAAGLCCLRGYGGDDVVWVIYGFSGRQLADIWTFDTGARCWESIHISDSGTKPSPRSAFGCIPVGDTKILMVNGQGDSLVEEGKLEFLNDAYVYDTDNETFRTIVAPTTKDASTKPQKRGWLQVAGLDSREVLLFGGLHERQIRFADTWILVLPSL